MKKEVRLLKWPRHYAREIMAEPDIDLRRNMLAKVPDDLRPIVESHVRIEFERRRHARIAR